MQFMIPGEAGHVRLKEDHDCWQSVDMHKKTQDILKKSKTYEEKNNDTDSGNVRKLQRIHLSIYTTLVITIN